MVTDVLLQVRNMSRRFGGLAAVSNLSFDVYKGEIFGLIGPNGAGKSTTFNVVSGFLPPSEGTLRFEGQDISHLKPHKVCHKGLVRTFQHDSYLREMTVRDNILVATFSTIRSKADREQRICETAELLNLTDFLGAAKTACLARKRRVTRFWMSRASTSTWSPWSWISRTR